MAGTAELGKNLKEKVDAEAARAEAEETPEETTPETPAEPSTGEDAEGEQEETPPEPEPADPGDNPEALRKGLDRAMRAFHRKLCDLFGTDNLIPVPLEGALGFMLPGMLEPRTHPNFK